jgi:membrane-bound lytic murein transglycosylase A
VLIDRKLVPKDEMSMQRIREWMLANPDQAKELRRQNKSYVFFRITDLSDQDEAVGGEGVPLMAGRSIAVDRSLHAYGTPFFIQADLPIANSKTPVKFHRLVIAQDTGSAIVGPARADIYFGAGDEAAQMAGRIRNAGTFVMLLPRVLDPVEAARDTPLPLPRPADLGIAKFDFGTTPDPTDVATPEAKADVAPEPPPAPKPAAKPAAKSKSRHKKL